MIVSNERGANQYTKEVAGKNYQQPKPFTSEKLASEYNVSEKTVRNNAKFSKVVDILPKDKKEEVLNGDDKISITETETILNMPKPIQTKFIKEVEKPQPQPDCLFEGEKI